MPPDAAPWSVPVRLADLDRGPRTLTLQADERTRARIARLLRLVALESFTAEARVSRWLDGAEVEARWAAAITQTCGVSLEPFDTALEGAFTVRAVPPASPLAAASESDAPLDPEAEDPPDVLEGDVVDVGAYLVEHLALEVDPFPRKPGVQFEPPPEAAPASPFAVLLKLRPGGESGEKG